MKKNKITALRSALKKFESRLLARPTQKNIDAVAKIRTHLQGIESGMGKDLKNIKAVYEYLSESGWDVSQATVYRHAKEGLLTQGKDGKFKIRGVDDYAISYLKPVPGSGNADEIGDLQKKKLVAQVLKAESHAQILALKANRDAGQTMNKTDYFRDLAARVRIFKRDLIQFAFSEAPKIVELVNGDPEMVPDLIFLMKDKFDDFLDRYGRPGFEHLNEVPAEDPQWPV